MGKSHTYDPDATGKGFENQNLPQKGLCTIIIFACV